MLAPLLRLLCFGVAAYQVADGAVRSSHGRPLARWRADIDDVLRIHGIASGVVVVTARGRRHGVVCVGQTRRARQALVNALNL